MRNAEAVGRPGQGWIALTSAERRRIAWHVFGSAVGMLLFAMALLAPDVIQFRMRMPGHIALYWFPALMAGRALSGYRGSSILVGAGGGMLANAWHPSVDSGIVGFVLAALAVEGILFLMRQPPTVIVGVLTGIAASLGKMIPKVATILTVGATPHHTWTTLPFMLESYVLFGALAGGIYAGGAFLGRRARSHLTSAMSRNKK